MVHLRFWAMSSPFFSPLAIPMFVCWGVSTALGVVIQYKITANNLNSGSSLLQFCNCCDRPKPDRWQDTSFFYKWRCQVKTRAGYVQYIIPLTEPCRSQYTQSLRAVLTTSSSPTCISFINPMLTRDETRALHVQRTLFIVKAWGWSRTPRHVFASRQELLTGIVQYPSHVLLMTNDKKRTRNV